MHRQAHEVLPALLAALDIDAAHDKPWLFGHSDGGSIALLYAARFPQRVAGAIVLAPHILVEDLSVASIEQGARGLPRRPTCAQRLAKYHDDPDSAFWGWNRIWLHPPFRQWSIEDEIARHRAARCWRCRAWTTSTARWSRSAASRAACRRRELLELPDCGHSPHRDQPDALIAAATRFIRSNNPRRQPMKLKTHRSRRRTRRRLRRPGTDAPSSRSA